jgi:hypothetical protein
MKGFFMSTLNIVLLSLVGLLVVVCGIQQVYLYRVLKLVCIHDRAQSAFEMKAAMETDKSEPKPNARKKF